MSSYHYLDSAHQDGHRARPPTGIAPYAGDLPLFIGKKTQHRRKKVWLWLSLFVLTIVLISLLVGLLVSRDKKSKSSSIGPLGKKNGTDPFTLGSDLAPAWNENLTAYGMYSTKRCEMLGPKLCSELKLLTVSVPAMRKELLSFWKTHGPDTQYGGFHGTLDRTGQPVTTPEFRTDKGVLQQARHLWSFSAYYELFGADEPGVREELKPIAESLYSFLMTHMLDKATNLFVFKVKRNGQQYPTKEFNSYSNWFAIQALACYAEAFQNQSVAIQALKTFQALDKRTWDNTTKGFSQLLDAPVLEVGVDGKPIAKGQNVHLHAMEAMTTLYRTTKNEQVKGRLREVVQLIAEKIFRPSPPMYFYAMQYFDTQWKPVLARAQTQQMVNHGHNLQYCWGLLDAVDTLDTDLPADQAKKALQVALGGGEYSVKLASTSDSKGFCTESAVDAECTTAPRVWWVQAESLLGLWKMYHLSGKPIYLKRLCETLTWVSNNQTDTVEFKEQFAVVDSGSTAPDLITRLMEFDGMKDAKGSLWKASYHSMRSLMFLEVWMKQVAKNDDAVSSASDSPTNTNISDSG